MSLPCRIAFSCFLVLGVCAVSAVLMGVLR